MRCIIKQREKGETRERERGEGPERKKIFFSLFLFLENDDELNLLESRDVFNDVVRHT